MITERLSGAKQGSKVMSSYWLNIPMMYYPCFMTERIEVQRDVK